MKCRVMLNIFYDCISISLYDYIIISLYWSMYYGNRGNHGNHGNHDVYYII